MLPPKSSPSSRCFPLVQANQTSWNAETIRNFVRLGRQLAEQVEAIHVRAAREQGWTWEQIGDALGVSRQSVHAKYKE